MVLHILAGTSTLSSELLGSIRRLLESPDLPAGTVRQIQVAISASPGTSYKLGLPPIVQVLAEDVEGALVSGNLRLLKHFKRLGYDITSYKRSAGKEPICGATPKEKNLQSLDALASFLELVDIATVRNETLVNIVSWLVSEGIDVNACSSLYYVLKLFRKTLREQKLRHAGREYRRSSPTEGVISTLDLTCWIMEKGGDVNEVLGDFTPLGYLFNGLHKMDKPSQMAVTVLIDRMLAEGANVNDLRSGTPPLANAVLAGQRGVIRHLVDKGAKLELVDVHGYKAIMYSIRRNKKATIAPATQKLLQQNMDLYNLLVGLGASTEDYTHEDTTISVKDAYAEAFEVSPLTETM